MTTDRAFMLDWIAARQHYWTRESNELFIELHRLNISDSNITQALSFVPRAMDNIGAGVHWGKRGARSSTATRVAIVLEALRLSRESQA
jgi:hypothetical protein